VVFQFYEFLAPTHMTMGICGNECVDFFKGWNLTFVPIKDVKFWMIVNMHSLERIMSFITKKSMTTNFK
jgi:hypothetical protein